MQSEHISAGVQCLVAHGDNQGQCIKCENCGFLRPQEFYNTECPGKTTTIITEPYYIKDEDRIYKLTIENNNAK